METAAFSVGTASGLGVDSRDVVAFFRANWERPIALGVESFYRWQFCQAPENKGEDLNCLAVDGGEILGVMGLNRRRFVLEGQLVSGAELTTWVVGAAARGKGIGRRMIAFLQQEYDLLTGFGISQMAIPVYRLAGFRRIACLNRYFLAIDAAAAGPHLKLQPLGAKLQSSRVPQHHAGSCRSATPADLAECAAAASAHSNLYLRDADAVAWRYYGHPVYSYDTHVVTDPAVGGPGVAVVLRFDESAGVRFLHVVDMFGDSASYRAAVSVVERMAREQACAFVDVTATNTRLAGAFLGAGWFSVMDDPYAELAHLFYPPELRVPSTTSAVVWSRHRPESAYDFGRLHLSKGDLDLDRPTLDYYDVHGIAR